MNISVKLTTTVRPGEHTYFIRDLERLRSLILQDPLCLTRCVEDPVEADIILFIGSSSRALIDIRASRDFRDFSRKCFVFHSGDEPLPTLPGIYASISSRWHDSRFYRGGFYLRATLDQSIISYGDQPVDYLFSFVGAIANHPVRARILEIKDRRGLIIDSSIDRLPEVEAKSRFLDSLRRSLFVLCPRGGGTSSFRIFETMQAGRCPVIISDEWVEPDGPTWSAFAVRIAEKDIAHLPDRLAELESRALLMGKLARAAWEDWFSPDRAPATIFGWLSELKDSVDRLGGFNMPPMMRLGYDLELIRDHVRTFRRAVMK